MRRILNFIRIVIAALPFYGLGYLSHYLFRHMPDWTYAMAQLTLFAALVCYIYSNRKRIKEEGKREMPDHLHTSVYTFLVMGLVIGSLLAATSFRTPLYIDNGTPVPLMVTLNSDQVMKVPAKGFVKTSVPTGENEILFKGQVKKLHLSDKGNWVFNIDRVNTYLESSVWYVYPANKNRKADLTSLPESDKKLYRDELFKTDADYLFNTPDSIATSDAALIDNLKKRVLSRVSPHN